MAVTMPWGEALEVTMELGFPVNGFTLDDPTLGELNGIGKLDGALEGIDVTPYVTDVGISRGRPDQLQQFVAGTATITLKNNDRRFDPTNQASPYWDPVSGKSGVTPRRKVTVSSNGENLFVGLITDIDIDYAPVRSTSTVEDSLVSITAADDFVLLANAYTQADYTPSEEFSGSRVEYVLDLTEVGYPATRSISTGTALLGGGATYQIDANTNVLSYLQEVNTSEQGYLFISRDGNLTFSDRIGPAFNTIAAQFSDTGAQIPYTSLSIVYGQEFLYNKVLCSIVGGTEQIANDAASQAEFGISTLSLTDLLLANNTEALELADALLDLYKNPEYRFDRLQSVYNALSTLQRDTLSTLEIGDVVEITRNFVTGTPSSITEVYAIEGIKHAISAVDHRFEVALSPTSLLNEFILNDATFGVLDTDNALAPDTPLLPFYVDQSAVDSGYTFT
jgi:hypothetical protein